MSVPSTNVTTPSKESAPPIIAIVGPTASGKSELGIEVALRLNGEIINCDSVQVYQQVWIATAKLAPDQRRGVPHHLIDFVPPSVNYTAGDWSQAAVEKINEIETRGRTAILVGGTGFYLRALRQPFFPSPQTDSALRKRINKIRERHGSEFLHRLLARLDPEAAAGLYPRDWPRLQRAIEVRLQTGERLSEQRTRRAPVPDLAHRLRIFALNPPRDDLYRRINERTTAHFAAGLVDEVTDLLSRDVPPNSNALGAHGYRRVVEYLEGKRDLESAMEQTQLDVRHYAKRQLTWFRREEGVEWINGFGDDYLTQKRVLLALNVTNR